LSHDRGREPYAVEGRPEGATVIVVHGLWRDDRLALWAEDSAIPVLPTRASRSTAAAHPFAVASDLLAEILDGTATKAPHGTASLSLPSRSGTPVESPELVRDSLPEHQRGAVGLRDWLVPTLEFEADEALAVLCEIDPDKVTIGGTVRHLAQLAGFAHDLVVRGRVLPRLVRRTGRPLAVWRPVLTGADAGWAQALTLALPPAGRATGLPAREVVAQAVDALVDAAARTALAAVRRTGPGIRRHAGGTDAEPAWRAWLDALTGSERGFAAGDKAVAELDDALAAWQRDASAGQVRACFRLVEPTAGDLFDDTPGSDEWHLEFALQAADEPSLLVDADRVWKSRGTLRALARGLDSPQETLLTELGRASRLYPDLDDALRTARPAELLLDGNGAHRFLREGAPMLAGAGFGVLLPGWWSKPRARLGARLTSSSPSAPGAVNKDGGVGLDAIVDYEWQLAIGDEALTEDELRSLSELHTSLVRLRGQWVELDAKRLASALKMISSTGQMTVADLLQAGLSTQDGPGGLPVVSVTADGPLGDLLSGQVDRRLEPIEAPANFAGTLRPYQERGLAWLSFLQSLGLGGVLADDMGLGKTVQMLALLARDAAGTGPTLLVCPMSLVGNWKRETEKFAPTLRVHVHHGAERARGKRFEEAVENSDLVITTYAIAARDSAALSDIKWHRLVVDEAQAIKNAATRQAVAVRALPARHRIAVTGTPVENRLSDLWSIMEFANPGLLGTAQAFKKRYAEPVERRGDEAAAERLKRLTGPFVLRRVKTDRSIISDLPEKLEMEVLCNLTAEQASLYQSVVADMMAKIEQSDGIERRGLVLATMTKLKQVCNHPAQLLRDGTRLAGRSGKLSRLEEILDEVLAGDEKALLFTQYAEFGGMLRSHLAARFGREVAFLHGGVAKAERDSMVARFQSDEPSSPSLFVLSLKAGGTGLTLTAANHVVHVDRWWNPAVEDQATDRAFRIGQKRNVQVRKFVCAGTVEEKIAAMIRDKRGLAAKIVGSGEGWITELSTSDLRDLFALESGAVVE
jgi:SNF2-related domain/SNF2 Helicase protein/Helicase conserved C-terminal domain